MKQIFSTGSLIFLISFCLIHSVHAQVTDTMPFNVNSREILMVEIEKVLTLYEREDCQKTLADLKKSVRDKKITEDHFDGFLSLANIMVKRKMKRFNYIQPLLEIILKFAADPAKSEQVFPKFIDISTNFLQNTDTKSTKAFEDYLKWSEQYWVNGNFYKVSEGSHTWKAEDHDYDIRFENKELVIRQSNATLHCFLRADSLTLKKCNFTFYPNRPSGGYFVIEKAQVDWEQDGAMDASCVVENIQFNGRETSYSTEKAVLTYPTVFKMPIEGVFSDRISRRHEEISEREENSKKEVKKWVTPNNLRSPKFASKSRNIKIEKIGEGVDYVGGFRMEGNVVKGYGDNNGRSVIQITNAKGQLVAKASASQFEIVKGERVLSLDAEVSLYFEGEKGIDSIYHPNIKITYNIVKRTIELDRGDNKASRVPFFNSMQKTEINTTHISWKIDDPKIKFGKNDQSVSMHSDLYFNDDIFEKYYGIGTINPLIKFAVYAEKKEKSKKEFKDGTCKSDIYNPEYDPNYVEVVDSTVPLDPELSQVPAAELPVIEDALNPNRFDVNEILLMMDRRMEKLAIMSCSEINQLKKNSPYTKVIKSYDDYLDYERNQGKKYKDACIDAFDVISFCYDRKQPDFDKTNTLSLVQEMIADGFVTYNTRTNSILLRDKIFHYKNSMNKKMVYDFDRIRFNSKPVKENDGGSNAELDIQSKTLQTNAISSFNLSDSQKVYAEPLNQQVGMKPNRNIDFDGVLNAGMAKFTGRKFHFFYDKFQVQMDSVDYVEFFVYERDKYTKQESEEFAGFYKKNRKINPDGIPSNTEIPIRNQIRNTKGLLLIEKSNNKSGKLQRNSRYPSFESEDSSYVYFERLNRMNKYGEAIYPADRFYYQVYPFILDSLNPFNPLLLKFRGRLISDHIFPTVHDDLGIMFLDLSLGFEGETKEPFKIFTRENQNGKGIFTGIYGISNQGLLGRGRVVYLGADIKSDYIEFIPNRMVAERVEKFELKQENRNGVEYPQVSGQSVTIDWQPYVDSMSIESNRDMKSPFSMFGSPDYAFNGILTLTPGGLYGNGIFDWSQATLQSKPDGEFKFGKFDLQSPYTSIAIKQEGQKENAIQSNSVAASVDFAKQQTEFIANEKEIHTQLPFSNYKTLLDKYQWDMKKNQIAISGTNGKEGEFLATEKGQDSLNFTAERAMYDMKTGLLTIDGVEVIRVADAFIYPDKEHLDIVGGTTIIDLSNSRIVADTSNQNHQIQRANITIKSKSEYLASGFLEFNVDGFKNQEIKFEKVVVKSDTSNNKITTGSGFANENDSFYLDSKTRYKGDIYLSAKDKNLRFKGFAKMVSRALRNTQWFSIDSKIDKKNVAIEYQVPQNPDGDSLYVGMFLSIDSMGLYPCIMDPKMGSKDPSIFQTKGIMRYDKIQKAYLFGDSSRVMGASESGKLMTVIEPSSRVNVSGKMDFGNGFNKEDLPSFTMDCNGDFHFFTNKETELKIDMSALVKFYIPEALLKVLESTFSNNRDQEDQILYTSVKNTRLPMRLKDYINNEAEFTKIWEKATNENILNLPATLKHSFFFSDLSLQWTDITESFVSRGKIGLSTLNGKHIGISAKGAMEMQMDPARGDVLTFYLEKNDGNWVYFRYTNGIVETCSNITDYDNALNGLKKKDTKVKSENGNFYEIMPVDNARYDQFKQRVLSAF